MYLESARHFISVLLQQRYSTEYKTSKMPSQDGRPRGGRPLRLSARRNPPYLIDDNSTQNESIVNRKPATSRNMAPALIKEEGGLILLLFDALTEVSFKQDQAY